MKVANIKVSVKMTWWLRAYLRGVGFACDLTGLEPNMDRVGWWIARGIKVELISTQQ
ncbi:hypothetical protein [Pseudomonas sp.]|uniref:hypothetical protein n=1 Tax=Pseudomonas sp. TaxID=306 RepID=UPI0032631FD4